MLGRTLLITFQQALRSVALTLFPIGFISLIAWATAGSATGNTSDPIRAALWIWLAAHLIPFHFLLGPSLTSGGLTYLPLGAAIFPFLAIRSGFKRSADFIGNVRAARLFIVIWYLLFVTLGAALSQGANIKPVLYLAPVYAGLLALAGTIELTLPFLVKTKFLWQLFTIIFGGALIVAALSMAAHFKIVHDLAVVIQPGWVGGALFLVMQLLYLPNIALATISYLFGPGFTIGAGTQIDPFQLQLTALPAIPTLGALPTGRHPLLLLSILILPIFIFLYQWKLFKGLSSVLPKTRLLISQAIPVSLLIAVISFLAGGELITKDMYPVGITWWGLPAIFIAAELLVAIFIIFLPAATKALIRRGQNV